MIGKVHCMSAIGLLQRLSESSVDLIVLDPPSCLGVGESEDETPLEETISALVPIATESLKALRPGGLVVFMSDNPQLSSAWEVAAAWSDLRYVAELAVLWDMKGVAKNARSGLESMMTTVRWYVKSGLRYSHSGEIRTNSNIAICKWLPVLERHIITQRPVEMLNYVISLLTNPKDIVVDPYCGSGSTLVAAEMCNRRWIGGDINPAHVAISQSRVAKAEIEEHYLQPMHLWFEGKLMPIAG